MNWLDKLERKFGRYAIRNLPLYIVMLYAIGAVLNIMTKGSYYYYVAFNTGRTCMDANRSKKPLLLTA